jgi:hypothetical protein
MSGQDEAGPTGRYPFGGKLSPDDEGELVIFVSSMKGHVRIDFGKSCAWLCLSPETALRVARAIVSRATLILAEGQADDA